MVITLDRKKRPLGYCTPKRARQLIGKGRACVYRYYPFTVILKDADSRTACPQHDYNIKIDPGTSHTGIAVTDGDRVVLYLKLEHRGGMVASNLKSRKGVRRNRRSRETIYRRCKLRKSGSYETPREEGWLPPSIRSILGNILHWVKTLTRLLGPARISLELVKFDTQLLENPDVEGLGYQRGTLYGYEIRSYLMEKYQHTCQYCAGKSGDRALEWEHMLPKSRGGSNRVKNATLACHTCNQEKGSMTPQEWLSSLEAKKKLSELDRERIRCIQRLLEGRKNGQSLRYAAWANSMRWKLYRELSELSMDGKVTAGTGGRTAYNRHVLGIPKDHHLDALCCCDVPGKGYRDAVQPVLSIKAMGRGSRLLGHVNQCGIINVKYRFRNKRVDGIQTGDLVKVTIPNGKCAGVYKGRVMVRRSGSHDVRCMDGRLVTATKKSEFKIMQRTNGYQYGFEEAIPLGNKLPRILAIIHS